MASKKKIRQKAAQPSAEPTVPTVSQTPPAPAASKAAELLPPIRRPWVVPALMAVFFLGTCFTTETTIKSLAMSLMVVTILSCLGRFSYVRDRLSLPMLAVAVWILMNGISTFYAVSGKFALRQFLRLMVGFCCFLLILAWSRRGRGSGHAGASILAGGTALASLVSIDTLSTQWFSGMLFGLMEDFSDDFVFASGTPIEAGVRMNSIYENPNVFAGIAGLGVLLSLGLAVTARRKGERPFHLVCLFLNALAFLLVFSMGASGMISVAFLALLLLERKERKASLLMVMIETLILSLLAAFPIFLTSFDVWDGLQPIPLLCAVGGAAALCLLDRFVGQRLASALEKRGGKLLGGLIAVVLAVIAVFAALAVNLTGPASLGAGEVLRRAEYPNPGAYTLDVQATGAVSVTIQSQNQQETMMHTETTLYSGDARGARFTVPEDSMVVYFNFRAGEKLTLESASFSDGGSATNLKLHYKLLPGFIANRLQGLLANENAIQRVVFFADGMKLFRESPIIGQGLGAFQNGVRHIQSFYYVTAYAHNHYIETLFSTGIIGLILFVGMLVLCAAAILLTLRKENADPLAPGLGAALVFIMGHGAVEVVLSFSFYLPIALGVLGLICLCCGEALPILPSKEDIHHWFVVALGVLVGAFGVTLLLNMQASSMVQKGSRDPYVTLERAAKTDLYEWFDYATSYIYTAQGIDREAHWDVYTQANRYAQRLGKLKSNSIPPYVAQYYFSTDQRQLAYEILERYVTYLISDDESWQTTFDLLETYSDGSAEERAEAAKLYQQFQAWNAENMGSLSLTESNLAYIGRMQNP